MIYEDFKRIRRKFQGKYFKEVFLSNVITYRHIIKVDFCDDSSDRLKFYYYYYYSRTGIETDWSVKYKIEELEGCFGEKISASEYKKGIKQHIECV